MKKKKQFISQEILTNSYNTMGFSSSGGSTTGNSRSIITIPAQADGSNIQPAIQSAVNSAQSGTQIVLPLGSYIIGSKVTIPSTKNISFAGSGILNTILSRDESLSDSALTDLETMFLFNTGSRLSSNIVVENIYFKSQFPEIVDGDGGSLALDSALIFNNGMQVD